MRLIGDTYLGYVSKKSKNKAKVGRYLCVCGSVSVARVSEVERGIKKTCNACSYKRVGKATTGRLTKHGMAGTRMYHSWRHMKDRCFREKDSAYHNYGGRGVGVSDEFMEFDGFYTWAINNGYKDWLTLDKIDNDADYSPSNCRWADKSVQAANRRATKTDGYIGVFYRKDNGKYRATVKYKCKKVYDKHFDSEEEAAIDRDRYIIENSLPHTLNFK